MKKKALVLFSGGLDSRIAAKMMEEQGFEVELCFIKLPFGGGCCNDLPCIINFSQTQGFKLHIVDSTKGDLFREYLDIIKKPKHGRGVSMNACKDCKIFMFIQAKKLSEEIDAAIIVTGEVLGQRPMSQMKKALTLDEEEAGLPRRILRPLSAKLLPETIYESEGLVNREKLLEIHGRTRKAQMEMADKYKIKYPSSGGGCLLCEDVYGRKLKFLFEYNPEPTIEEITLLKVGRMAKDKGLIYIGRDANENAQLKILAERLGWEFYFKENLAGPTIIYEKKEDLKLVEKLWDAYSSKDLSLREKFKEFLI